MTVFAMCGEGGERERDTETHCFFKTLERKRDLFSFNFHPQHQPSTDGKEEGEGQHGGLTNSAHLLGFLRLRDTGKSISLSLEEW